MKGDRIAACQHGDCITLIYARGFCKRHYTKLRQVGLLNKLPPMEPKFCKADGCSEKHSAKGLCQKHYRELKVKNNPMVYKNVELKRQERHRQYKLKLIKMRGGKCEICGYSKNMSCFDFHHKDPSKKEHEPKEIIRNPNFEIAEEYLKQCVLVCKNCHFEIHHPDTEIK
jgi:hypothetical protein